MDIGVLADSSKCADKNLTHHQWSIPFQEHTAPRPNLWHQNLARLLGTTVKRVALVEPAVLHRHTTHLRIIKQHFRERPAAQARKSAPCAVNIAKRHHAVRKNQRGVTVAQHHFANHGAFTRFEVERAHFVGKGSGTVLGYPLQIEIFHICHNARSERPAINEPCAHGAKWRHLLPCVGLAEFDSTHTQALR